MENLDRKIEIQSSNGQFYIWNIDDIKFIRKNFKVIGSFVGLPSWKALNFQNKIHGLPLKLLDEECLFLLTECKDAKLIKQNLNSQDLIDNCSKEFDEFNEQYKNEFKEAYYQNATEQIRQKLDLIVKGKAKKNKLSFDQINRDQILEEEIMRIKPISEDNEAKQFLVQSPWSNSFKDVDLNDEFRNYLIMLGNDKFVDNKIKLNNEKFKNYFIKLRKQLIKREDGNAETDLNDKPILKDEYSLLRYLVYRDLNKKGLYVTKGNKFGSDFLAYLTDPLFCHAAYLVVCINQNQQLTKTLLHTYTRLGSQVNKNVLLVRFKNYKDNYDSKKNNFDKKIDYKHIDEMENFNIELEYLVIKWSSDY